MNKVLKDIPDIEVYKLSNDDMASFEQFVNKKEPLCKTGLMKCIPNKTFDPFLYDKDSFLDSLKLPHPIEQFVNGKDGIYELINIKKGPKMYKKYCNLISNSDKSVKGKSIEEKESMFWNGVKFSQPIYGSDTPGSLFAFNSKEDWNLSNLPSLLQVGLDYQDWPGITVPFLYFGCWKSMFGYHQEDMNLLSINYLHFGEPKIWYSIPASENEKFEKLMNKLYPKQLKECDEWLRHKSAFIHPAVLIENGIKVYKAIQKPGEFIITLPGAYHGGFNLGYNCAEAVNFATSNWIKQGLKSRTCNCDGSERYDFIDMIIRNLIKYRNHIVLNKRHFIDNLFDNLSGCELSEFKRYSLFQYNQIKEYGKPIEDDIATKVYGFNLQDYCPPLKIQYKEESVLSESDSEIDELVDSKKDNLRKNNIKDRDEENEYSSIPETKGARNKPTKILKNNHSLKRQERKNIKKLEVKKHNNLNFKSKQKQSLSAKKKNINNSNNSSLLNKKNTKHSKSVSNPNHNKKDDRIEQWIKCDEAGCGKWRKIKSKNYYHSNYYYIHYIESTQLLKPIKAKEAFFCKYLKGLNCNSQEENWRRKYDTLRKRDKNKQLEKSLKIKEHETKEANSKKKIDIKSSRKLSNLSSRMRNSTSNSTVKKEIVMSKAKNSVSIKKEKLDTKNNDHPSINKRITRNNHTSSRINKDADKDVSVNNKEKRTYNKAKVVEKKHELRNTKKNAEEKNYENALISKIKSQSFNKKQDKQDKKLFCNCKRKTKPEPRGFRKSLRNVLKDKKNVNVIVKKNNKRVSIVESNNKIVNVKKNKAGTRMALRKRN